MEHPVGLVLGGGGVRGAYQMGVWKAYREEGISFAAVAGTSVGAINGAMVAQGDFDSALEAWTTLDISHVMNLSSGRSLSFSSHEIMDPWSFVSLMWAEKKLDITPLRETLSHYIDEKRVRESPIQFALCTVSLHTRKFLTLYKEDIPEGQLIDYILASSALPMLFRCKIDGQEFFDGGLIDNLPLSALLNRGYHELVAVDIAWRGLAPRPKLTPEDKLTLIRPASRLGSILRFNADACRHHLERGYLDARRVLGHTVGHRYYLAKEEAEPVLAQEERALVECLHTFSQHFWLSPVCRQMLPMLRRYAGVRVALNAVPPDLRLYRAFMEIAAESMGIPHEREYNMPDLRSQILHTFAKYSDAISPLFAVFDAFRKDTNLFSSAQTLERANALGQALINLIKRNGPWKRLGLTKLLVSAVYFYGLRDIIARNETIDAEQPISDTTGKIV